MMDKPTLLSTITLSLFIGSLGLPVPENPLLVGGGYAIFKQTLSPWTSLACWYSAIYLGDIILYALSYWFFARPKISGFVYRRIGLIRIERVKSAFTAKALQTIFWGRMAFGLRAAAYIVAGAAQYPWKKFLLIDAFSVAVQTLLFVGIGYYSGERIEWARQTADRVAIMLAIVAAVSLLLTWLASAWFKKLSGQKQPCSHPGSKGQRQGIGIGGGKKYLDV